MKWLTEKQVKKHATTPAKALNISIKHWQQIVDATAKETKAYKVPDPLPNLSMYLVQADLCGLCQFYKYECNDCILMPPEDESGCGGQWEATYNAFEYWLIYRRGFRDFKKEARKMLKILKSLKGKK